MGQSRAKQAEKLAAELEARGIESSALDELIHEAFAEDAAGVNNGGLNGQVRELLRRWGPKQTREILKGVK